MITILATVDGSPISAAVIPVLQKLVTERGARVHLLTVVERPSSTRRPSFIVRSPTAPAIGVPGGPGNVSVRETPEIAFLESDDQAIARARADAEASLDQVAQLLRGQGADVETEVVMADDPGDAIIEAARHGRYDFVAMATHGRAGLSDLVQGSTAAKVVRSGVAPVLLVRPSEN